MHCELITQLSHKKTNRNALERLEINAINCLKEKFCISSKCTTVEYLNGQAIMIGTGR